MNFRKSNPRRISASEAESDTLDGRVERVTFHSPESGFAVLKIKVRGKRDLRTVVGVVPSIHEGEWIRARGDWVMDPKHGPQFKAVEIKCSSPNTAVGIEKYLGSGLIRGIGPQFASRLVNAFGLRIFEVIEHEPQRLLEVEGIGPKRRDKIRESWAEQKVIRDIMVFLHSHGVSTARAHRIYRTYGENSIEIVRSNPYRLARDVWGIGFKTADQIAEQIGIDRNSELRARAGLHHTLAVLTSEGHCAYERESLIREATRILEIDEKIVESALTAELGEGLLIQREFRGRSLVYLASLDTAERLLAEKLVRLSGTPRLHRTVDPEKACQWIEEHLGLKLGGAQKEALKQSLVSKVMVITGGPGVGKTTLIRSIIEILIRMNPRIRLAAPTGRAAKRLSEATGRDATTIHRLLEFDPSKGQFKHHQNRLLKGDVFIIDEASMIDLALAYQLIRAIPDQAVLVLVGDVDQLPSVGPGNVLRDIIESGRVPVRHLDEVFRQSKSSSIVTAAHAINAGRIPDLKSGRETVQEVDRDFYFIEARDKEHALDLLLRLVSRRIPERFGFHPLRDIQVLTPMQKGELGARNLNSAIQDLLNPPRGETEMRNLGSVYRPGDKVMQLINNYDKDVFNGDLGTIRFVSTEDGEIGVRFDDRLVRYDRYEMDELGLAYAVTVHKSQGSEYPCVLIPLDLQHYVLLQRNLLYTAITRGKKLVVLVGSRKALAIAVRKTDTRGRITTLKERILQLQDVLPPQLPGTG